MDANPFPGLTHFTLDSYLIMLPLASRHQVSFFESLVWLDLVLNRGLSGHWWSLKPLCQLVLRYFANVRHNSAASNAFAEVVNVTGLWDAVLAWYSLSAPHRICLNGFEYRYGIHSFRPNRPCLIVDVPANRAIVLWLFALTIFGKKFFGYFCGVMSHFESIKHKSSN